MTTHPVTGKTLTTEQSAFALKRGATMLDFHPTTPAEMEFFIREAVGHEIAARMRMLGDNAATAADAVMAEVKALGGTGGVIVAGADGHTASSFTTPGMYRGYADATGARRVAIFGDESLDER